MHKKLESTDYLHFGLTLHQQGQYQEAEKIYTNAINENPNNFNALQLLGTLLAQNGEFDRSIDVLAKALEINPKNAAVNFNLGNALAASKRYDEATISYKSAIEINSENADYYFNAGFAMQATRKIEEAIEHYKKAIKLNPKYTEAYLNCGIALQSENRIQEAIIYYQSAIAIKPNFAQAYSSCGNAYQELKRFEEALLCYQHAIDIQPDYAEALVKRGDVQQRLGNLVEALESYEHAIEIEPANAEAFSNCGVALQRMAKVEEALIFYDRAISLSHDYAEAYSNRGNALKELSRFQEAIASYNKAIELKAGYLEAYCNRANTYLELNQITEALESYNRAIEINPNHPEANYGKATILLLQGKYKKGWELYESRWDREVMRSYRKSFEQPSWLGIKIIKNKTILLYSEQGLGDTIQFFRYAKLVKELGATVIIEVPKVLVGLFHGIDYIDRIIEKGQRLPSFDYQIPLMSLPLVLRTEIDNIPAPSKYLYSDDIKRKEWNERLKLKNKPRVGLVWSTSTVNQNSKNRTLKLSELIPFLPDCCDYVCLQKEVKDADKAILESTSIKYFLNDIKDFTDTAALCDLMDVVISIDTSVAHLAGALGKPAWVLLPFAPEWRWLLERSDSPWYNSVKLYRQDVPMQWETVFTKISGDLQDLYENIIKIKVLK